MTAREYKFKETTNIDESYQQRTRPSRTATTKLMIAQSPEQHKQRIAFSSTALHKKNQIATLGPPKAVMKTLVPRQVREISPGNA